MENNIRIYPIIEKKREKRRISFMENLGISGYFSENFLIKFEFRDKVRFFIGKEKFEKREIF